MKAVKSLLGSSGGSGSGGGIQKSNSIDAENKIGH